MRKPSPKRPGSAEARVAVSLYIAASADTDMDDEEEPSIRSGPSGPRPLFPKQSGRAANVRARLDAAEDGDGEPDGKERWVAIAALTTDWKDLADSVGKEVRGLQQRYEERVITAWSVYVSGADYGQ